MKKTILALTIIMAIFLSFGFIVMKNPVNKIQLEQVSVSQNAETGPSVVQDSNDEQWD